MGYQARYGGRDGCALPVTGGVKFVQRHPVADESRVRFPVRALFLCFEDIFLYIPFLSYLFSTFLEFCIPSEINLCTFNKLFLIIFLLSIKSVSLLSISKSIMTPSPP